jgi:drug/metabolite transporter (DMT)-like permease
MKQFSKTGHISIFMANVIFGLNTPISKTLMPNFISPMALTLFRMVGAFFFFLIASLFIKREKIEKRDYLLLLLASLFGIFINQFAFLQGLSHTSPIDASLVVTTLPILAMLISAAYLKEPITRLKVFGVLIGALGALLIIFQSHTIAKEAGSLYGNLLCFVSCFSYAFYLVFFKNLMGKYHPIRIMKWMFLYASIICIPICYKDVLVIDYTIFSLNIWLKIIYVVFGATFLSYLLIPIGIKNLRPTTVSMYNYVQPLVASIVAVFLGLDSFGFIKTLAAFLVFFGVFLVTQSKSKVDLEVGD